MTILAALKAFFEALAGFIGLAREKRLMDAGRANERANHAEAEAQAREAQARAAAGVDSASDDQLINGMRENGF